MLWDWIMGVTLVQHALIVGLILIAQTNSIALFAGLTPSSFWFSCISVLVFLGECRFYIFVLSQ
jgi:hypothetical protein